MLYAMKYFVLILAIATVQAAAQVGLPAFPGAEGFGAMTTGGRGGQVVYVTSLECEGPGTLNEALQMPGKKYILFKVSGIINCVAEVAQGDCYIAGQTSPGGIIVRGMIVDDFYNPDNNPHNIIIRHIRSRGIGSHPLPEGTYSEDPLTISGVHDIIVDHCSLTNSTDEAIDISRSHNITIQNCLLAETLGEHAYLGGMLVNYSTPSMPLNNLTIHHNLWNRIGGRMPEFSCEDPTGCIDHTLQCELSNNVLWDQQVQTWYNTDVNEANPQKFFLTMNIVNNLSVARHTYGAPMFLNSFLDVAQNQLFVSGNKMNLYEDLGDYDLFYCCDDFSASENHPNTSLGTATRLPQRNSFPIVTYTPTTELQTYVTHNVGAFPRFAHEQRLMRALEQNVIDETAIGEATVDDVLVLPFASMPQPPTDSDNDGMPDSWETSVGLNPQQPNHNGLELSMAIMGVEGYTNLECYLHCLSNMLINGAAASQCGSLTSVAENSTAEQPSLFPNPTSGVITIHIPNSGSIITITIVDAIGRTLLQQSTAASIATFDLSSLSRGLYIVCIHSGTTTTNLPMVRTD